MNERDSHGRYFFLSYAHSPPTVEGTLGNTDHWVRVFYSHLRAEVAATAKTADGPGIGFYDDLLPPGSDWKALLADALGTAEVFVPLYSPTYLARSWPLNERESFRHRLAAAGAAESRHIQPVLWIPAPSSDPNPELDGALALGADIPAYARNGLRGLCMISSYREQYRTILQRLARRIVQTVERSPMGPSPAPVLRENAQRRLDETSFVIASLAPTSGDPTAGRPAGRYSATSAAWRPFAAAQALPAAEYAANVAELLGLPTRIIDLATGGELLDTCPAVVLIDPWIIAGTGGEAPLAPVAGRLHAWVTPLVVLDRTDSRNHKRGVELATEISDMLFRVGAHRVKRASQVDEFVQLIPALVTEARRQYLRNAPVYPPKGPHSGRPRLVDHPAPPFHQGRKEES